MLPVDFIDLMHKQLGSEADLLFEALSGSPVVSIRLNDKLDIVPIESEVQEIPWNEDGYYLLDRPVFTLDPLFHCGCYYVQEAASMFLEVILRQLIKRDAIVLDLCAAPGGKATLLSQYLGMDGLLIANEVNRNRLFTLSENIQKWGIGNVLVTHNQAHIFGEKCKNLFDCILVDAPCSGEGLFRKEPDACNEWSLRVVKMCTERQRAILMNVWDALKPGGFLIYSTCTFNYLENEDNVEWACECLGAEEVPISYQAEWGITRGSQGYHFYPHKTRSEGLYICVIKKEEQSYSPFSSFDYDMHSVSNKQSEVVMKSWLLHPEWWKIHQNERFMTAYPYKYRKLIECLYSFLTCISFGVGIGESRGKFLCPQHSLSMLKDLRCDAFPQIELTREKAIAYLKNEPLSISSEALGVHLFTFNGVPLGFGKNIGLRFNNLYPNEWRIRHL